MMANSLWNNIIKRRNNYKTRNKIRNMSKKKRDGGLVDYIVTITGNDSIFIIPWFKTLYKPCGTCLQQGAKALFLYFIHISCGASCVCVKFVYIRSLQMALKRYAPHEPGCNTVNCRWAQWRSHQLSLLWLIVLTLYWFTRPKTGLLAVGTPKSVDLYWRQWHKWHDDRSG